MKVRDIIKHLVQPNFSWFEYTCMYICILLLPTIGWWVFLSAIPIVAVSTVLKQHFN